MLYEIEKRTYPFTAKKFQHLISTPHIHPHLELIYLEEGSALAAADSKEFLIEAGDIYLSFPNQIHFYHAQEPLRGYIFIFSPELFGDFKDIFQSKVPTSALIKGSSLSAYAQSLPRQIYEKKEHEKDLFAGCAAKGYLLALLGEILPSMTLVPTVADHDSIKSVLTYCTLHYTENLTLDSLSKALHLNKYYISHIFRERMNLSFTDFINTLRIEHACSLLGKNSSITEVAFASGFSSIRTFNRVFSDQMKMAPREYIRLKAAKRDNPEDSPQNAQSAYAKRI